MKCCFHAEIQTEAHAKVLKKNFRMLMFLFFSCLFFTNLIYGQSEKTVTVKGTVANQGGEPLQGVTVQSKTGGKATTTLQDGSFQLEVPQNSVLTVSYVGFISKDIKVGTTDQSNLGLNLIANKNEMEQVIVVGYGTRKKSDVTGAIVSVSEQAIKDIPAANLAQALQGQGAGIDIQKNGGNSKPGATPSILIRGSRSISATNEPLIVVDGIPFNGNFNDLNQDDVSSVEVLKDASATAIYGSRGANGVILVSTKRGRLGKPVVTYSGYAGASKIQDQFPVMNTQEFFEFKKWALYNGRFTGNTRTYSGIDDPDLLTDAGNFSPEELDAVNNGRSTDWQKLIYQTGLVTNHQIGFSGGHDKTQYAVSGGYFKETGIYFGQAFERFTLKASVDQQLGKIVKIGISSLNTYSITDGEGANPLGQALRASPLASPYNADGSLLNDFVPGSASQVWNPLANFVDGASVQKRKRFGTFTTFFADVNILRGLKYRFNTGIEIRNDVYGEFFASKTTNNLGGLSTSQNRTGFRTSYTLENILTYDRTFNKHKVNATGLFSIQEDESQSNQFRNNTIAADLLQYFNPTYGANLVGEGEYGKWDILSYMGRLNYSFNDRYLLTLAVRVDGSSRLAPGNKYNTFPSAAVAWNLSKESFLENSHIFSNLKLRASYGRVGSTAIDPYQTLGGLSSLPYNYGDVTTTGVYLKAAASRNLTWEYTSTANLGVDFGLLNNRISGSIEIYKQSTESLLLPKNLPSTSGIPDPVTVNVGKTENKGIELQLSTINIQSRGRNSFSWTTDLNFFINRGKITALANGVTKDVANSRFVGQPIGVFYDWKKAGIWQATAADTALAVSLGQTVNGISSVIGNIKREDISGPDGKPDGKLTDTYDRVILGSSQPKWEGGMTNRFSYMGFDLTVVAFARWGHMIRSGLHGAGFANTFQGTYNNIKTRYWTPANGENEYPKPNANQTNTPNNSLLGYYDGSFVKIRTISVGYKLPASFLKKLGAGSVRVYATVEDPFILFSPFVNKYGGLDPEVAGSARNPSVATLNLDTPSNWSMIFGVNISF